MPSSRAIKPKRDDTLLTNWESVPERAPSIERADRPLVARILAMIGLFLLVLGTLAMLAPRWQRAAAISPAWGFFLGTIGLCFILFHAYSEHDHQFRRLYGFAGLALAIGGIVLRLLAFKAGYMPLFMLGGVPALFVGLIVLIGVVRNETDAGFRTLLLYVIGGIAGLIIAFCLGNSLGRPSWAIEFLSGQGALLLLIGLLYASAFIGLQESNSEIGYYTALGLGAVGLVGFFVGLIRSMLPESNFLVPAGLILMAMSILYIVVALGVCIDWPVIVLTRRELAAYFYSPLAYLVIVAQLILGWIMFREFTINMEESGGMFEPIVGSYVFSLIPVIVITFLIPVLTMRLLSEEKRSGTLEVLLTAPVNEISVVLGKFLASWIFYNLLWAPAWVFLISLRFYNGAEFDFRPVLSFTVAMGAISAGLLAMGLFFSSLTSNQIIAAVFTFVGVMAHLALYIGKFQRGTRGFADIFGFINYLDFMLDSLQGILAPRLLMFHLAVGVFFLFATVKVLESRKWK